MIYFPAETNQVSKWRNEKQHFLIFIESRIFKSCFQTYLYFPFQSKWLFLLHSCG